jgi:hypothetical protein
MEEWAVISLFDPYNICTVCTCYLILQFTATVLSLSTRFLDSLAEPCLLLSNVVLLYVQLLVRRGIVMIAHLFCLNSRIPYSAVITPRWLAGRSCGIIVNEQYI